MDNVQQQVKMPRKAKAIINRLLQTKQISSGGLNWLIAATDPFHDAPLEVTGYPDANQANSIVQVIHRTFNLSRPDPLVEQIWDAHVFFAPATPTTTALVANGPIDMKYYRHSFSQTGELALNSSQTRGIYAGYNAIAITSGQNWTTTAASSSNSDTSALSIPISYCGGQFRLVGAAVEVVNTTAALYQSGACTAYRIPSTNRVSTVSHVGIASDSLADIMTMPPGTQDQAILMPTSKTWGATEGLYSVSVMNSVDNPLQTLGGRRDVVFVAPLTGSQLQTTGSNNLRPAYSSRYFSVAPNSQPLQEPFTCSLALPFDINGAVFSGLHPETSLQITVKYLMERIPTFSETDIVPLARAPPGYDPVILELYSRVMSELPVGVTVAENPLGEWFWEVLKGIETIAPVLGTALSPFTGGISQIAGTGLASLAEAGLAFRPQQPKPKRRAQSESLPKVEEVEVKRVAKKEVRKEMNKMVPAKSRAIVNRNGHVNLENVRAKPSKRRA